MLYQISLTTAANHSWVRVDHDDEDKFAVRPRHPATVRGESRLPYVTLADAYTCAGTTSPWSFWTHRTIGDSRRM